MFGHRFFGKRFFGPHFFGPRSGPPAQALLLTGFRDADAFGGPHLTYNATLHPTGFTEADRFGIPVITKVKVKGGGGGGGQPGGATKGQKYGNQVLIDEDGLVIGIRVNSSVAKVVSTRAALYSQSGSLPNAKQRQSDVKTTSVVGANDYTLTSPIFVTNGTTVWPALHSDGNFAWFLASGNSRFNDDAFVDGPSDPFGTSQSSNKKAPIFALLVTATDLIIATEGFANSQAFGSPSVSNASPGTQEIDPTGFKNTQSFGTLTLTVFEPQAMAPDGFVDADAFGSPAFSVASVTLQPTGFADGDAFGTPTFAVADFTLLATGFADPDAFGSPLLTQEAPLEHHEATHELSGTRASLYTLLGIDENRKVRDGTLHDSEYEIAATAENAAEDGTIDNIYEIEGEIS